MNYKEFKKMVNVSKEQISAQILEQNRSSIKVKKEKTVITNLIKIIDATLDICSKKSFQAMSIRDLSAASGLSRGALYSYFTSKEELLILILTQGRQIAYQVLKEQIPADASPREKLQIAIKTHIYLSEVMSTWFYFNYIEARNLPKVEQKRVIENELETEKIFIDIIEEGNKEGIFAHENAVLVAAVIKAILQDWYLKRWKYRSRKISVDDYADFVIDTAEAILLNK